MSLQAAALRFPLLPSTAITYATLVLGNHWSCLVTSAHKTIKFSYMASLDPVPSHSRQNERSELGLRVTKWRKTCAVSCSLKATAVLLSDRVLVVGALLQP